MHAAEMLLRHIAMPERVQRMALGQVMEFFEIMLRISELLQELFMTVLYIHLSIVCPSENIVDGNLIIISK